MKNIKTILILLILAILVFWLWQSQKLTAPETKISEDDTTAVITQELESLNTLDLESEFKSIDTDLESL